MEKGSLLHFLQVGAKMSVEEMLLVYVMPIVIYMVISEKLREFAMWNAICQLILFIPVVMVIIQLPPYHLYETTCLLFLRMLFYFYLLSLSILSKYTYLFIIYIYIVLHFLKYSYQRLYRQECHMWILVGLLD